MSFNGNKVVTTGGGGAIITNDEELGKLAKHLTTTARVSHKWSFIHDQVGFNYRLPNINAALGCAQLEQLPAFIGNKRALARRYAEAFAEVAGIRFFTEPDFAKSNYWLNVLLLDEADSAQRTTRRLAGRHQSARHHDAAGMDIDAQIADVRGLPAHGSCRGGKPRMQVDQHTQQRGIGGEKCLNAKSASSPVRTNDEPRTTSHDPRTTIII